MLEDAARAVDAAPEADDAPEAAPEAAAAEADDGAAMAADAPGDPLAAVELPVVLELKQDLLEPASARSAHVQATIPRTDEQGQAGIAIRTDGDLLSVVDSACPVRDPHGDSRASRDVNGPSEGHVVGLREALPAADQPQTSFSHREWPTHRAAAEGWPPGMTAG